MPTASIAGTAAAAVMLQKKPTIARRDNVRAGSKTYGSRIADKPVQVRAQKHCVDCQGQVKQSKKRCWECEDELIRTRKLKKRTA